MKSYQLSFANQSAINWKFEKVFLCHIIDYCSSESNDAKIQVVMNMNTTQIQLCQTVRLISLTSSTTLTLPQYMVNVLCGINTRKLLYVDKKESLHV
jgi:hypothetical protein